MQKVLATIVVENPCRENAQMPQSVPRTQLRPYNRAEEEEKMGNFNLEEGVDTVLIGLGDGCEFNLDELKDFNSNIENLIRANNINRGPNNIIQGSQ